ncbi:hypothetical protein GEMRC1_004059 [Eukaryota sp. GEM-RC1]
MKDVGPSLQLIQSYHSSLIVSTQCSALYARMVDVIILGSNAIECLKILCEKTTNDSDEVALSIITAELTSMFFDLIEEGFIITVPKGVMFHNPLVRRAVCTYLDSGEISSYNNISKCHEIRPIRISE